MEERSQVGKRIFDERKKKEWSQKELAEKVGTSRESIVKWEKGERFIKAEDVISLASAFGCDCHYLLTGSQRENIGTRAELGLSDFAINTLKDFRKNSKQHPQYIARLDIDESSEGAESINIVTPQEMIETLNLLLETHNGWRLLGLVYRYCFADFDNALCEGEKVGCLVFPNRAEKPIGETRISASLMRFATLKAIETELESLREHLTGGGVKNGNT